MLPDSPPSNRRVTRETARRQRFQRGRKPPTRRGARACDSRRKPIGRRESGHRMAAPPFARSSRNTFPLSLSTLFLKRSGNRRAACKTRIRVRTRPGRAWDLHRQSLRPTAGKTTGGGNITSVER